MAIQNIALSNTNQAILGPVPLGASYAVTVIMVCNTASPTPGDEDADSETLFVNVINGGDETASTATNTVINGVTIRAGETFTLDTEKLILEEGDTIAARLGGTGTVSATVSYVEI